MKKEMIRIKGARENNLKKDREDIWNHYLLMQDSSWDRWRNRM